MKKLSIVLVLLLTVGLVGAFAVDFEPVVEFSSEVENTFGVDLNEEMSTGFDLSAEADLSVMFVDTTVEKGEGDVYGWIQVEDLVLGAEIDEESDDDQSLTGSIGDINARVIFNPAYLQISTAPGFSYDNAEYLRLQVADDNDPVKGIGSDDLVDTNAGIIIGADGLADMVDVAFKIGSVDTYEKTQAVAGTTLYVWYETDANGDVTDPVANNYIAATDAETNGTADEQGWVYYEGTDAVEAGGNIDNEYAFGLDLTVTPMEMLSVSAGVVFSNVTDAGIGLTLNPVFTMAALEAGLPVDAYVDADSNIDYEVAPYVTYDLNEDGSMVGLWSFMTATTEDVPGNPLLDVKFGFAEVAEGFVPGLETSLYGYLFDVLDTQDIDNSIGTGVEFHGAYDIDGIKPFIDVYWANTKDSIVGDELDAAMLEDDDTTFDPSEEVMTLTAGVDLALIENTVFTLKYASDNLLDDTMTSYTSDNSAGTDKGRITFSTTISY